MSNQVEPLMDPRQHELQDGQYYVSPDKTLALNALSKRRQAAGYSNNSVNVADANYAQGSNYDYMQGYELNNNNNQYLDDQYNVSSQSSSLGSNDIVVSDALAVNNEVKKNNFFKILSWISSGVILLSIIGMIISMISNARAVPAVVFNSAYQSCASSAGKINQIGTVNYCNLNGKIFVDEGGKTIDQTAIEKQAALNNQILFGLDLKDGYSRFVVGQTYPIVNLPKGVTIYISPNAINASKMIVNNLYLPNSGTITNDVYVKEVLSFLNRDQKYTGTEPLGSESTVIQAFSYQAKRPQTKTIAELDVAATKLEKIRSVYGLDGDEDDRHTITVRVFGKVRDNVIMLMGNLDPQIQKKIDTDYWQVCKDKSKFTSDVENCLVDKINGDADIRSKVQDLAKQLITDFNLQ